MDAELQQAFHGLPAEPSSLPTSLPNVSVTIQVAQFASLVDGDLPLHPFLEQLLPLLCSLFPGIAAVTWLKAHGSNEAIVGVRYQMDRLLLSADDLKQHERLVQLAWRQPRPLMIEATEGPAEGSSLDPNTLSVSSTVCTNTTKCPLLFAPIHHLDEPLAMLEVALRETVGMSTAEKTARRQLFLRAAELVAQRVYGGLRRRITLPPPSIDKAVAQLQNLSDEVRSLQQQIRVRIEGRLQQFHGWAFQTLEEKQAFAKIVQQMLESHGLRVQCPECGHAAILRCMRVGNAKQGAFVFDHYLDSGRTFHGGSTTVPVIRVVAKPARRLANHV